MWEGWRQRRGNNEGGVVITPHVGSYFIAHVSQYHQSGSIVLDNETHRGTEKDKRLQERQRNDYQDEYLVILSIYIIPCPLLVLAFSVT